MADVTCLEPRKDTLSSVTRCAESAYHSFQQNIPQTDYKQVVSNGYEFSFDEEAHLIHRNGVLSDIEGLFNSGGRGILSTKWYIFYFLTMTFGFLASLFTFTVGTIFIFQCPFDQFLPDAFIIMGATGAIPLLYIIYKLLRKKLDGFTRLENALLNFLSIILLTAWLFAVSILNQTDTIYSAIKYCKPEFYRYTVIANLISIFAFAVHIILQYSHRVKEE